MGGKDSLVATSPRERGPRFRNRRQSMRVGPIVGTTRGVGVHAVTRKQGPYAISSAMMQSVIVRSRTREECADSAARLCAGASGLYRSVVKSRYQSGGAQHTIVETERDVRYPWDERRDVRVAQPRSDVPGDCV